MERLPYSGWDANLEYRVIKLKKEELSLLIANHANQERMIKIEWKMLN